MASISYSSLPAANAVISSDTILLFQPENINAPFTTATLAQVVALAAGGSGAVSSVAGKTGTVTLSVSDISGAASLASPTFTGTVTIPAGAIISGYAPLVSPSLSGVPTAPTATLGTNTTQVATTAFVLANAGGQGGGVVSVAAKTGVVTLAVADVSGAAPLASPTFTGTPTVPGYATLASPTFTGTPVVPGYAPLASPTLTGVPIAPTATQGTNSTQIATTAYVLANSVTSVAGRSGAITLGVPDVAGVAPLSSPVFTGAPVVPGYATLASPTFTGTPVVPGYAPLASPALTGVPIAPTATPGTNSTQLATTAYVLANSVTSVAGRAGSVTLAVADVSGAAPTASPNLTGTPLAPTATVGTNSTQLATTAFVLANQGAGAVASVAGRTGTITLAVADVTGAAPVASPTFAGTVTIPAGASISGFAPLASPALTGTPAAPTAAANTNTTQIATTAFATVAAQVTVTTVGTSGASQSLTFPSNGKNICYDVTKTANCAFSFSGGATGVYQTITLIVRPGAGGFTESFSGAIGWPGGTPPTPSTSATNVYIVSTPDVSTTLIGSY